MSSYPNPDDPNQPNQYPPNQGQTGTQYGGGYQSPPIAPSGYGDQPPYQPPQPPPNVQPGYGDQPSYQQGGYQQGAYQQQPYQQAQYQQPPYQQSPYPQRASIAFDWRYPTAGIGALVALIAFFLPYYGYNSIYSGYAYLSTGYQTGNQILLDAVIALVALAIATLLQFGSQLFKAPTSPTIQKLMNSLTTRQRTWGLILMSTGIFGFFFRFILDLGRLNIWAFGSWLYTIGMIAVIVGGFFVWKPPASRQGGVPPIR